MIRRNAWDGSVTPQCFTVLMNSWWLPKLCASALDAAHAWHAFLVHFPMVFQVSNPVRPGGPLFPPHLFSWMIPAPHAWRLQGHSSFRFRGAHLMMSSTRRIISAASVADSSTAAFTCPAQHHVTYVLAVNACQPCQPRMLCLPLR